MLPKSKLPQLYVVWHAVHLSITTVPGPESNSHTVYRLVQGPYNYKSTPLLSSDYLAKVCACTRAIGHLALEQP